MTQELIKQIYGGELTAEATKLLKYIYAGAQPIEDNDFALMFGKMNLAKFVEVKAKEDEILAKQSKKIKEEHHRTNSMLSTELQEAHKYIEDLEQEITQLENKVTELDKNLRYEQSVSSMLSNNLTKKSEDMAELKKTIKEQQQQLGHEGELRGEILELKAERDKLSDKVIIYKMDNGDLQADIDRLRHQLEAIKNIIAL